MKIIKILVITAVVTAGLFSPTPSSAAPRPLDTNVVDQNGTVYRIMNHNNSTVRRAYTSAGAFLSYSFNSWANVMQATAEDMALPQGEFIPPRDGTVFCSDRGSDRGTCYLITTGQKAGFTSEAVFRQQGFTFRWALYGDASFLPSTSLIDNGSSHHRHGTLVNKDGTVYLATLAGLVGIPSMGVLSSWGYWDGDIIPANGADRVQPVIPATIGLRIPGYLTPSWDTTGNDVVSIDITTNTIPNGVVGQNYSATFNFRYTTTGTNYALNAFVNLPPPGLGTGSASGNASVMGILTNNQGNGSFTLRGIPTTPGTYPFTVRIQDPNGRGTTKNFSLTVTEGSGTNTNQPSITTSSMPNGTVGGNYSRTFQATGGTAPYTWEVSTTHPCCYVGIHPNTGVFSNSGTNLTPLAGTWSVTVTVRDSQNRTSSRTYSWTVVQSTLQITNSSMPYGIEGENYSLTFQATGGTAPYTWSIYSTTHPCCFVGINPNTGVFSNISSNSTPQMGSWDMGIEVTDATGVKIRKNYKWDVYPTDY